MMPRIELQLYINPGAAEVFVNIRQKDGIYQRFTATVDTGAEVSLMPFTVLNEVEHRITMRGSIIVDQAGIAKQSFSKINIVRERMNLKSGYGLPTQMRCWWASMAFWIVRYCILICKSVMVGLK